MTTEASADHVRAFFRDHPDTVVCVYLFGSRAGNGARPDSDVDLVHRILRDGIVVFDRDPSTRIRFEVKARNLYFDLLPVLQRYRRVHEGD